MALVDYLPRAQLWRHFDASPQVQYELHMSAIQPELLPTTEIINSAYRLSSDHPERMAAYGSFQGTGNSARPLQAILPKGVCKSPQSEC